VRSVKGGGIAIGLSLAWILGRIVNSLLVGITAADPVSMATAIVVLAAAGTVAAWFPARRLERGSDSCVETRVIA
jgi:ABC-type antimicrobial peptide transport system permease subunit